MFFPETLYLLSQRDRQVTWLDPYLQSGSNNAAALFFVDSLAIPVDRVLLLQHAFLRAGAGAAQTVTELELNVFRPGAGIEVQLAAFPFGKTPVQTPDPISWQGSIIVPSGASLQAKANFSAGAAANADQWAFVGILIPNANIARV